MTTTLSVHVKNIVRIHKEMQQTDAKLKKLKAQKAALIPLVLDWFTVQGYGSVNCTGFTVASKRELWASLAGSGEDGAQTDKDVKALREALEAAGIEPAAAITLRGDSQKISALVRDYDANDRPLPNSLAALLNVSEKWGLSFTKAAKRVPPKRVPAEGASLAEQLDDSV